MRRLACTFRIRSCTFNGQLSLKYPVELASELGTRTSPETLKVKLALERSMLLNSRSRDLLRTNSIGSDKPANKSIAQRGYCIDIVDCNVGNAKNTTEHVHLHG